MVQEKECAGLQQATQYFVGNNCFYGNAHNAKMNLYAALFLNTKILIHYISYVRPVVEMVDFHWGTLVGDILYFETTYS